MKTSTSQFEVMVEFMERHGDLMKPAEGPHGRVLTARRWEELSSALNLDNSGSPRTSKIWKKVWSDFKSNTRRKAAKIEAAVSGTGGGPASTLALTDLEQRTLNIMGPLSATGLPGIPEVGVEAATEHQEETQAQPTPQQAADSDEMMLYEVMVPLETISTVSRNDSEPAATPAPQQSSQRRRRAPLSPSPSEPPRRRARRSTASDAAHTFMSSDAQWRLLAAEHIAENARRREQELQQQAQWQVLFARCLDILERFIPIQDNSS